jgi:competence protein ComEA
MEQPTPALASGPAKPDRFAAWPRSLQLATAVLAGMLFMLLILRGHAHWSARFRPLEIESDLPLQFRIDLNDADRATLLQVPGIGEAMAERILSYRQDHGPFQSVKQLLEIHGIGSATLERLRPWIEVKGESFAPITRVSATKKQQAPLRVAGSPESNLPSPGKPAAAPSKVDGLTGPIPINTASLEELQKLPRVGLKRAQQIIEERSKSPFQSIEDLRRVSGIGAKTLESLRPYIMLNAVEHNDAGRPNP